MSRERKYSVSPFNTRLYNIWVGMRQRCNNQSCYAYKWYGARGITVCEEWNSSFCEFRDWSLLNGYADNLTLDRINNNGDYEPSNCRWATWHEQARNRRGNIYLSFQGERHTISEWSRLLGVKEGALYFRKHLGWSDEQILTTSTLGQDCYPILNKEDFPGLDYTKEWFPINGWNYYLKDDKLLIRSDFGGVIHSLGIEVVEKALCRYSIHKAKLICLRLKKIVMARRIQLYQENNIRTTYSLIRKVKRKGTSVKPSVSITKRSLFFCSSFRDVEKIKRYILFSFNEEGVLQFKFFDEKQAGCCAVTETRNKKYIFSAPGYVCSIPSRLSRLGLTSGCHEVIKCNEWYIVPTCKTTK